MFHDSFPIPFGSPSRIVIGNYNKISFDELFSIFAKPIITSHSESNPSSILKNKFEFLFRCFTFPPIGDCLDTFNAADGFILP